MKYQSIYVPGHLYFTTDTVVGWKNIFYKEKYVKIVLNSLNWLRSNHFIYLYSFVIMPSHFHIISKPRNKETNSQIMQKFNSFTGHKLATSLIENKSPHLNYFREIAHSIGDREYRIWDDPFDENIFTENVLIQKMEYIHNNPIQEKWHLVKDRADYPYSSARFYDRGEEPIIKVDDVRELF